MRRSALPRPEPAQPSRPRLSLLTVTRPRPLCYKAVGQVPSAKESDRARRLPRGPSRRDLAVSLPALRGSVHYGHDLRHGCRPASSRRAADRRRRRIHSRARRAAWHERRAIRARFGQHARAATAAARFLRRRRHEPEDPGDRRPGARRGDAGRAPGREGDRARPRPRPPKSVVASLRAARFSCFTAPFDMHEIAEMVQRAIQNPDWKDGLQVLSARPDWLSLRVDCRRLAADRLVQLPVGAGPGPARGDARRRCSPPSARSCSTRWSTGPASSPTR